MSEMFFCRSRKIRRKSADCQSILGSQERRRKSNSEYLPPRYQDAKLGEEIYSPQSTRTTPARLSRNQKNLKIPPLTSPRRGGEQREGLSATGNCVSEHTSACEKFAQVTETLVRSSEN